jgi:putative oxidoreductase
MEAGPFLIHAVLGAFLIAHGMQHGLGLLGGGGIAGTGAWFESLGLRHGKLNAALAGGSELVGGALMLLGLLTPLAAAMVVSVMLVAARTDHRDRFWIYLNGAEYVLFLAVAAVAMAFSGPGEWSLDHALGLDLAGTGWGIAAAAAGVLGAGGVLALFRDRDHVPEAVPAAG